MITYNKYIDTIVHTWYDSSNLLYSKCYDSTLPTVTLNVVFSDGRTYKYLDVAKDDYLQFQMAQSNGKAFGQIIRPKYKGIRMADTSKEQLDQLREQLVNMDNVIAESRNSDLVYNMKFDDQTGQFALYLGNRRVFRGVEGQVSIINLLKSLNINYTMSEATPEDFVTDEKDNSIVVENMNT